MGQTAVDRSAPRFAPWPDKRPPAAGLSSLIMAYTVGPALTHNRITLAIVPLDGDDAISLS